MGAPRLALTLAAVVMLAASAVPARAAEPDFLVTDDGTLRSVGSATLVESVIGTFDGGAQVTALARGPGSALWAAAGTPPNLVRIDLSTAHTIGSIALSLSGGANAYADGLTFEVGGSALIAVLDQSVLDHPSQTLHRVDLVTEQRVAPWGAESDPPFVIESLATTCAGTVDALGIGPSGWELRTLDTSSGALILVAVVSSATISGNIQLHLAIAHATGTIWLIAQDRKVYTLKPATGVATLKGVLTATVTPIPGSVSIDPLSACRIKRTATLTYSTASLAFKGRLSSAAARCRTGTRVTVWRVRSGPDAKVGGATADGSGRFTLPAAHKAGRYLATVAAAAGDDGTCLATTSATLTLH